jgi:hypothetical protein
MLLKAGPEVKRRGCLCGCLIPNLQAARRRVGRQEMESARSLFLNERSCFDKWQQEVVLCLFPPDAVSAARAGTVGVVEQVLDLVEQHVDQSRRR